MKVVYSLILSWRSVVDVGMMYDTDVFDLQLDR